MGASLFALFTGKVTINVDRFGCVIIEFNRVSDEESTGVRHLGDAIRHPEFSFEWICRTFCICKNAHIGQSPFADSWLKLVPHEYPGSLPVAEGIHLKRNFLGNLRETSLGDKLLAEERCACGLPPGDNLRIYFIRNDANDFNSVFWMKIGKRTTDQPIRRIY